MNLKIIKGRTFFFCGKWKMWKIVENYGKLWKLMENEEKIGNFLEIWKSIKKEENKTKNKKIF